MKKEEILKILDSWQGVPYFHQGKTKHGVDCTGFIQRVYFELGIIETIDDTRYSNCWFLNVDDEYILEGIERARLKEGLRLKEITLNEIKTGDLICFKNPRILSIHHTGIFYELGKFIHATNYLGVHIEPLCPFWINKVAKVFTTEERK